MPRNRSVPDISSTAVDFSTVTNADLILSLRYQLVLALDLIIGYNTSSSQYLLIHK